MQEFRLYWAMQPAYVRLFIIYLFVIVGVSIARSLALVWLFYSGSIRRSITGKSILKGGNADLLARSGLANVRLQEVSESDLEAVAQVHGEGNALQTLRLAEHKFLELWQIYNADLHLMKGVAQITVLLSFAVLVYGAMPTLNDLYNNGKLPGSAALLLTLDHLFSRLAFGLLASVILYSESIFLDSILTRRLANWKHFTGMMRSRRLSEQVRRRGE